MITLLNLCAIYCRVSTDLQRERHTINSQLSILPRLAKQHGLAVYKEYIDNGISGESIEARPAFKNLLDDASAGKFKCVLVIDFDRLTRATDLTQLALIKKIFRDSGIKVITPSQVFDFHDADQDFLSDLFGILAKHEKRKIVARVRRGIKEKMKQGKWIMGRPPTPYYKDKGRLAIDETKKDRILEILSSAKDQGRSQVSRRYALGQGTLRRILSRKRLLFYAGRMEIDGEIIKGDWQAIISMNDMEDLLLHTSARATRTEYKTATYLLTGMGIFVCGACKRAIGSHTDSAFRRPAKNKKKGTPRFYRRAYYRCNNRQCSLRSGVTASDLIDALILKKLEMHLKRMDLIMGYIAEIRAGKKDNRELKITENRITEEERKRKNLISAISQGIVRLDEAGPELEIIRKRLEDLSRSKQRLLEKSKEEITEEQIKSMKKINIKGADLKSKRRLIQICIQKIVLRSTSLAIYWRFPIKPNGDNKERFALGRLA